MWPVLCAHDCVPTSVALLLAASVAAANATLGIGANKENDGGAGSSSSGVNTLWIIVPVLGGCFVVGLLLFGCCLFRNRCNNVNDDNDNDKANNAEADNATNNEVDSGEDALQDESVRPQQAAAALTAAQADGCRRLACSDAAVKHSIPHGVVSQVVSPEIAAFMKSERVVVRTHHDEMCCVDTVEVAARDPALCAAVVKCLEQFPHLGQLMFDRVVVDAATLAAVGNLDQLQHLRLSSCHGVDSAGLAAIGNLSQLQHLDLSWCRGVDSAGLAAVGKLSQLRYLALSCCDVNAGGLAAVGKLSQLQRLNISWCRGVDSAGLARKPSPASAPRPVRVYRGE